jgi:hypothetical protein
MATVWYKVDFGKAKEERKLRARQAVARRIHDSRGTERVATVGPTAAAHHLAAAYKIERMLANGEIAGFKEAADLLGGSPSWVSHIMNLLNLRPEIQGAILAGEVMGEERLKRVARVVEWPLQGPNRHTSPWPERSLRPSQWVEFQRSPT